MSQPSTTISSHKPIPPLRGEVQRNETRQRCYEISLFVLSSLATLVSTLLVLHAKGILPLPFLPRLGTLPTNIILAAGIGSLIITASSLFLLFRKHNLVNKPLAPKPIVEEKAKSHQSESALSKTESMIPLEKTSPQPSIKQNPEDQSLKENKKAKSHQPDTTLSKTESIPLEKTSLQPPIKQDAEDQSLKEDNLSQEEYDNLDEKISEFDRSTFFYRLHNSLTITWNELISDEDKNELLLQRIDSFYRTLHTFIFNHSDQQLEGVQAAYGIIPDPDRFFAASNLSKLLDDLTSLLQDEAILIEQPILTHPFNHAWCQIRLQARRAVCCKQLALIPCEPLSQFDNEDNLTLKDITRLDGEALQKLSQAFPFSLLNIRQVQQLIKDCKDEELRSIFSRLFSKTESTFLNEWNEERLKGLDVATTNRLLPFLNKHQLSILEDSVVLDSQFAWEQIPKKYLEVLFKDAKSPKLHRLTSLSVELFNSIVPHLSGKLLHGLPVSPYFSDPNYHIETCKRPKDLFTYKFPISQGRSYEKNLVKMHALPEPKLRALLPHVSGPILVLLSQVQFQSLREDFKKAPDKLRSLLSTMADTSSTPSLSEHYKQLNPLRFTSVEEFLRGFSFSELNEVIRAIPGSCLKYLPQEHFTNANLELENASETDLKELFSYPRNAPLDQVKYQEALSRMQMIPQSQIPKIAPKLNAHAWLLFSDDQLAACPELKSYQIQDLWDEATQQEKLVNQPLRLKILKNISRDNLKHITAWGLKEFFPNSNWNGSQNSVMKFNAAQQRMKEVPSERLVCILEQMPAEILSLVSREQFEALRPHLKNYQKKISGMLSHALSQQKNADNIAQPALKNRVQEIFQWMGLDLVNTALPDLHYSYLCFLPQEFFEDDRLELENIKENFDLRMIFSYPTGKDWNLAQFEQARQRMQWIPASKIQKICKKLDAHCLVLLSKEQLKDLSLDEYIPGYLLNNIFDALRECEEKLSEELRLNFLNRLHVSILPKVHSLILASIFPTSWRKSSTNSKTDSFKQCEKRIQSISVERLLLLLPNLPGASLALLSQSQLEVFKEHVEILKQHPDPLRKMFEAALYLDQQSKKSIADFLKALGRGTVETLIPQDLLNKLPQNFREQRD